LPAILTGLGRLLVSPPPTGAHTWKLENASLPTSSTYATAVHPVFPTILRSESNWQRLLEDLRSVASKQRRYFLGSIILKQQQTGGGAKAGDARTVIDGQQRLSTLLLLFKLCSQVVLQVRGLQ
jgi:hypothetical protein